MPFDERALAALRESAGDGLRDLQVAEDTVSVKVQPNVLEPIALVLRDHPAFMMQYPADLVAHDTGEGFGLWYRLWSYVHNAAATVSADLPADDSVAPSLVHVWPGLNWYERECFDMFGIRFRGHPLDGAPAKMRILLPEDWIGHPFRRDYQPEFAGDPLSGPQETN